MVRTRTRPTAGRLWSPLAATAEAPHRHPGGVRGRFAWLVGRCLAPLHLLQHVISWLLLLLWGL